MNVEVTRGRKRIVRAADVIDYSNVRAFDRALEQAARDCPAGFIIDLSEATYMDSAGVQAVLSAYRLVTAGGGVLAVVLRDPNTRDIIRITGAQYLPGFHMCEDLQSAERIIPECEC